MKILLSSPLPPPAGGIASWTVSFMEYGKKSGHQIEVVNTALIGKRSKKESHRASVLEEIKRTVNILQNTKRKLKSFNPEVFYINSSCSMTGLMRDAVSVYLGRKYKMILHCHCDAEFQMHGNCVSEWLMKYIIKYVAQVFVLNQNSYFYLKSLGCSDLEIVPNFISDVRKEPKIIRDKIENVLFAGHVRNRKGCAEIVEAARHFPDIQFTLMGPVDQEIAVLNKTDNVIFTGAKTKNEVAKAMEEADIFLLPTYTEGFSVALLEAMAAGLPVITTDVGANKDMIEDRGGIIVPVGSSEAIIAAIEQLQNGDLRRHQSLWNCEKVENCYLQDQVLNRNFESLNKE